MKLNFETYRDKVYACWVGKNIGGTMGAPYEGVHDMLDIKGFATAANVVIPNDDLDLQLIWLYALENHGPHAINASMLGEHWISFIVPHWNEYGIGKANMKRGLPPPMAGDYDNDWCHSNGAWIRTEIWATVAPAMPHIAAKYALEDAMVDHGAGEGTFAAAFVAALQSAAFAIPDLKKCIEIGLEAIPKDSRMAKSIDFVLKCYNDGMSWSDARNAVQKLNADIGNGWFEAPSNVTYAVIGLLWGEGDFKKSMITAINCGDDTDCTGATVGATMGILYGTAGIPEDWRAHIGDDIVTISINKGNNGKNVPKTCTELTERVVAAAPVVVRANSIRHSSWMYSGELLRDFEMDFGTEDEIPENIYDTLMELSARCGKITSSLVPFSVYEENVMMRTQLTLDRAPDISPEGEIGVHVRIESKHYFEDEPRTVSMRWILPEGFTASGKKTMMIKAFNPHSCGVGEADFVIKAGESVAAENRIILEITVSGRCTPMYVSVPLFG
ncbi:MAG: ADP-ribosylglycohydrolase family protein [Clostridia bacterium]|nr:ADP-ribosylglycohydrolase family protein [Clostridia bacterium]